MRLPAVGLFTKVIRRSIRWSIHLGVIVNLPQVSMASVGEAVAAPGQPIIGEDTHHTILDIAATQVTADMLAAEMVAADRAVPTAEAVPVLPVAAVEAAEAVAAVAVRRKLRSRSRCCS
jgi:hypothetical protein